MKGIFFALSLFLVGVRPAVFFNDSRFASKARIDHVELSCFSSTERQLSGSNQVLYSALREGANYYMREGIVTSDLEEAMTVGCGGLGYLRSDAVESHQKPQLSRHAIKRRFRIAKGFLRCPTILIKQRCQKTMLVQLSQPADYMRGAPANSNIDI